MTLYTRQIRKLCSLNKYTNIGPHRLIVQLCCPWPLGIQQLDERETKDHSFTTSIFSTCFYSCMSYAIPVNIKLENTVITYIHKYIALNLSRKI